MIANRLGKNWEYVCKKQINSRDTICSNRDWLNVLLFGSKHWNISSSLQLVEKNKNNQEVDTSFLYVQVHKDNNTEPDPELTADTGL